MQYQVAIHAIIWARKVYYLANGEFTNDLAELDVQVEREYAYNMQLVGVYMIQ